jgi:hypothetical protein
MTCDHVAGGFVGVRGCKQGLIFVCVMFSFGIFVFSPSFFQYRWLLLVDHTTTDALPVKVFTNSQEERVAESAANKMLTGTFAHFLHEAAH